MNKCKLCGTEFDGKFCPECGTKTEQWRHCPECGADVVPNSKYCVECGYSFATVNSNQRDNKQTNAPKTKKANKVRVWLENNANIVFKTLKMTAWILPTLFAALLFLFYLAPVANLLGELDEKLNPIMVSIGTIYTLCGNKEYGSLAALSIAIIIIATLVFAYAVAHTVIYFQSKKLPRYIGKFSFTFLFSCGAILIYLIFLIISSVLLGQINSADGGMGIIEASACPKLLLSFSIIFLVLHATVGTVEIYLVRKYPILLATEQSDASAEALGIDDYIDKAKKQYGEYAYKRAADSAEKQRLRYLNKTAKLNDLPVSEQTDLAEQEQLIILKRISRNVKWPAVCTCFLFTIFILPCAIFGFLFLLKSKWKWNPHKIKTNTYKIMVMIVFSGILFSLGLLLYFFFNNVFTKHFETVILISHFLHSFVNRVSYDTLSNFITVIRLYISFSCMYYIIALIISIIELKRIKKLTVIFYGTNTLDKCKELKLEMGNLYQTEKACLFKKIDEKLKIKQAAIISKYGITENI